MKLTVAFVVASLLSMTSAVLVADDVNVLTEKEKADGWRLLFDGKTLNGWKPMGNAEDWAVEDGTIACLVKGGQYLLTTEQFDDFILSIDYKIEKECNSGVFFRWGSLTSKLRGIEMQILDSYGKMTPDRHDAGAIFDILAPSKNMAKPAGEWNRAVLTCRDNLVQVDLNGQTVCEMDLNKWTTAGMNPDGTKNKFSVAFKDMPRKGYFGLQDHGGHVWFRNIKLKPLKVVHAK